MALARARGLVLRLDDFLLEPALRPLLRFVELRLLERFERLPPAEPRLAELRFAVRLDLPRAADLLRDDFFAAICVCSCRGGLFTVPDSKIRAHNLRSIPGGVSGSWSQSSREGEKCVYRY